MYWRTEADIMPSCISQSIPIFINHDDEPQFLTWKFFPFCSHLMMLFDDANYYRNNTSALFNQRSQVSFWLCTWMLFLWLKLTRLCPKVIKIHQLTPPKLTQHIIPSTALYSYFLSACNLGSGSRNSQPAAVTSWLQANLMVMTRLPKVTLTVFKQ